MRERLPHPGIVRAELERVRKLAAQLNVAAQTLQEEYRKAYEAGLSPTSGGEMPTLGRGFAESDPTGQTATNAQLRQLRWRASKAAGCVSRAVAACEEGTSFLADGFLGLDPDEWIQRAAKRLAAEG